MLICLGCAAEVCRTSVKLQYNYTKVDSMHINFYYHTADQIYRVGTVFNHCFKDKKVNCTVSKWPNL